MSDPHHCKCFFVDKNKIEDFRKILLDFGFYDEFQENHGQLYGYVFRVEDKLQLHIKVMSNGCIESEMEPAVAYPAAHLNPKHSYSAHKETMQILQLARIGYTVTSEIPDTCVNPKIIEPINPTHASGFAAGIILGIATYAILKKLFDEDNE